MFIIVCVNAVVFRCIDSETFYPSSRNLSHSDLATHIVTVLLSTLGFASLFCQYVNQKLVLTQTGLNIPVIV